MAGLIFMAMLVVMVVVLFIQLIRQKPIKKLLIVYVLIIGSYHLIVSNKCGPNSADVKVMKPMAQKIADYIVAHGIPKSLKDIPDLPYTLECKHIELYKNRMREEVAKEQARYIEIDERCIFKKERTYNINYYAYLYQKGDINSSLRFKIRSENYTGIKYSFFSNGKRTYMRYAPKIYSSNTSGICNPMRM